LLIKFLEYDFLVFALLFMLSSLIMLILRQDLWLIVKPTILMSLPFALTEPFFYPDYWSPNFLFDFGALFGFGIEDFIFVVALSSGAVMSYPVVCRKAIIKEESVRPKWPALIIIIGIVLLTIGINYWLGWSLIWSACILMFIVSLFITLIRRDLLSAIIIGGFFYGMIYFLLLLLFGSLYPGIYKSVWHTNNLSNCFLLGVPLEEIIYGLTCGFSASACVPYIFNFKYKKRVDL
jgi:hypothetical protein